MSLKFQGIDLSPEALRGRAEIEHLHGLINEAHAGLSIHARDLTLRERLSVLKEIANTESVIRKLEPLITLEGKNEKKIKAPSQRCPSRQGPEHA